MKIFKKKAEMYIDTAVTILISFFILYVSVSLFSYFNQYQDMKNISNDLLKYCADKGYTSTADVEDKYNDLLQTYGLSKDEDKENVKISFSGTEYFDGSKVQLDDKIQLTIQSQYKIKLLSSSGINISTMSVTNSKNSNKYWKTEDVVSVMNNFHEGIIPEGGTYISITDGELTEGMQFPGTINEGDKYLYGDYTYTYLTTSSGWKVSITNYEENCSRESFGNILTRINKKYVTDLNNTFAYCDFLKIAPKIPGSVTNVQETFSNCYSLTTAPKIPNGVKNMNSTFLACNLLQTYEGSTDEDGDFSNYIIPGSVVDLRYTFYSCLDIIVAPKLPESNINMNYCFGNCYRLEIAPIIPKTTTSIIGLFSNCESLKSYHGSMNEDGDFSNYKIPKNISNISSMFSSTSIKTAPIIHENIEKVNSTFSYCEYLEGNIYINTDKITDYNQCFYYTEKPIILLGTSTLNTRANLMNTSNNDNISFHTLLEPIYFTETDTNTNTDYNYKCYKIESPGYFYYNEYNISFDVNTLSSNTQHLTVIVYSYVPYMFP